MFVCMSCLWFKVYEAPMKYLANSQCKWTGSCDAYIEWYYDVYYAIQLDKWLIYLYDFLYDLFNLWHISMILSMIYLICDSCKPCSIEIHHETHSDTTHIFM